MVVAKVKRKKKKADRSKQILLAGLLFILAIIATPLIIRYWQSLADGGQYHNLKNFGVPVPKGYNIHGIDVSHHQGTILWEEVAAMDVNGIRVNFAFIKATEGITRQDKHFKRNWKNAKKTGIICGAYHFFHPSRDAAKQAENFISQVKLEPGDLPPVLDIEVTNRRSKKEIVEGATEWCRIIEEHYGVKPIIYTGLKYYDSYLADDFADYHLWIAHYYKHKPGLDHRKWQFWQHSDKATINGIKERVDMNVWNESEEKLKKILVK